MKNKNILIAITASISAYKAYDVIRHIQKRGGNVRCIVTEDGMQFVNKLTLEALLQNQIYSDPFGDYVEKRAIHIALAEWADVVCVVPATADCIAKTVVGIADDIVLSTLLATCAKKIFAPAMHTNMWLNPITQANVEKLKSLGVHIVTPAEGSLSDGTQGVGHIAPLEDIARAIDLVI
jgi:phosphopantothenoylcysteine decarboxylase/phosphopantothenate--cysteine ligase